MAQAQTSAARRDGGVPRLEDDLGFLLSRASGVTVRRTNAALERFGLRVRQYSVLIAVTSADGLSQRGIAELLALDPSQIVTLVDELERAGLVERRPHPADRRTRLVAATSRGKRVTRSAERAVRAAEEEVLGALPVADRAALAELLRRLAGL